MAQSQVNVVFGASVTGLIAGVKEADEAIKSLRKPVDDFVESIKGVSEAAGIAFAVDKIREFGTELAEVGEHAVNMGLALGMSAEQFQQINEAMSLVGASGDALVRTERMLERAVIDATTNPLSRQADAFRALGIDAKQFGQTLQDDPIVALKQLAEAAQRTGVAVSGPLGMLLGRYGGADLLRFFSEGAAGVDKLIAKTKELGAPTNEMLHNLEEIAQKIHEMTTAMENFALTVAGLVKGPMSWFLTQVTEGYEMMGRWLRGPAVQPTARGELDLHDIPGATDEEMRQLAEIRRRESSGDYSAVGPLTSMGRPTGAYQMKNATWQRWAAAAGIRTDRYPTAHEAPMAMQDVAALYGLRTEGLTPWSETMLKGQPSEAAKLPDVEVQAEAEKNVHQARMQNSAEEKKVAEDKLKQIDAETKAQLAQLDLEKTAAQGNADVIHTIELQKVQTTEEAEAKKQAIINATSAAVKQALEGQRDNTTQIINLQNQAMRVDQEYHKQAVQGELELMNAEIKRLNQAEAEDLKQIQRRQQYHQLTLEEATQAEIKAVEANQRAVTQILQQEQQKAQGITSIEQRIAAQIVQLNNESAQKIKDINDRAEDDRLKKAQSINQSIAQDFSSSFMQIITGRETFTQAFAQLGEKLGQTLVEKMMEKFLESSIFGTAGGFGGLFGGAGFFGMIGKLFGFAGGGIVPSAAGGWVIPSFQGGGVLAQLHSGEMVLPRDLSEGMQGMIRGGGGGPSINIHAIDTQSGAQFLMQNSGNIANAWRAGGMYGNLSPRAISSGGRFP